MFAVRNTDDIKLLCLTALFGKKPISHYNLWSFEMREIKEKNNNKIETLQNMEQRNTSGTGKLNVHCIKIEGFIWGSLYVIITATIMRLKLFFSDTTAQQKIHYW